MNMGLMAADLSLGRAISERDTIAKQQQQQPHQHLLPDLHALEVYHKALEDERQKIQAFERELPFCMQLLDDAIEASREQLEDRLTCKLNTPQPPQFLCNYTSLRSSLPALGEINMSFKRKWKAEDDPLINRQTKWLLNQNTSEDQTAITEDIITSQTIKGCIKLQEYVKSDHVQALESQKASLVISSNDQILASKYTSLTNPHPINSEINPRLPKDQQIKEDYNKPISVIDLEKDHHPINTLPRSINATNHPPSAFSRSISITNLSKELPISALSPLTKTSSGSLQSVQRKPRRCWSPELHQRFLSALNHLGGCQVATPKQIRELMNVEGLTNDEVKSHLQKFRLHMRRPNNTGTAQADSQQAAGHHLVVFGHIWVPPEYGDDQQQANGSIITNNSSDGALELVKSFNNHAISNNDSINRAPLMRLCQGTDYSTEKQQNKAPQIQSLNEDEAIQAVVGKGSANRLIMQAGENAGSMEGREADHGFIVKGKTACVQLQLNGDAADDHDHDAAAAITTRANEIGLSIACSSSSNDINDNNNNNNGTTREASCS